MVPKVTSFAHLSSARTETVPKENLTGTKRELNRSTYVTGTKAEKFQLRFNEPT